jgi:rubrerythrin
MNLDNFKELLEVAIANEQEAFEFYTKLSERVKEPHVKETLLDFASQEQGHKSKLKASAIEVFRDLRQVVDLKIGDYLVDVDPTPELTFQGALILAMKREKAAYRMYMDLADQCASADLKQMFMYLAQEEANHKLHFEVQYDELIFQD